MIRQIPKASEEGLKWHPYSLIPEFLAAQASFYSKVVQLFKKAGTEHDDIWRNSGAKRALITQRPNDYNTFGHPVQPEFTLPSNDHQNSWRFVGNPHYPCYSNSNKKNLPRQLGMGDPINSNQRELSSKYKHAPAFTNSSTYGNKIRPFNARDLHSWSKAYIQFCESLGDPAFKAAFSNTLGSTNKSSEKTNCETVEDTEDVKDKIPLNELPADDNELYADDNDDDD